MGVSLAKEPYVRDARPSHDRCAMTGALLLRLQTSCKPQELLENAEIAAPYLLALCDMTRDDLETVAPIDWNANPQVRHKELAEALPVLTTALYAGTPCPSDTLRRLVLDVVRPLRWAMVDACRRPWYGDDVALAFADRRWAPRPSGIIPAFARFSADFLTLVITLIMTLMTLPFMLARSTKDSALPDADDIPVRTLPRGEGMVLADALAALRGMAAATDLQRARTSLKRHVVANPHDRDEAERVERHLAQFAEQIASADRGDVLTDQLRSEAGKALRTLIRTMDGISSRSSLQAAQDLETGIRFIVSAHGTQDEALSLPTGRLAA